MIDGEGVFVATHMIGGSGINEPVVGVSREAAVSHHGIGVVSRLIRRGGGRGGGEIRVILLSMFIGSLLEVAVVMGKTLAGTILTVDIGIRGAGRPHVIIPGGLVAFVTLSALLTDCECPQSGHCSSWFCLYIAKRLLDGLPGSGPAVHKVSNLRSPH